MLRPFYGNALIHPHPQAKQDQPGSTLFPAEAVTLKSFHIHQEKMRSNSFVSLHLGRRSLWFGSNANSVVVLCATSLIQNALVLATRLAVKALLSHSQMFRLPGCWYGLYFTYSALCCGQILNSWFVITFGNQKRRGVMYAEVEVCSWEENAYSYCVCFKFFLSGCPPMWF